MSAKYSNQVSYSSSGGSLDSNQDDFYVPVACKPRMDHAMQKQERRYATGRRNLKTSDRNKRQHTLHKEQHKQPPVKINSAKRSAEVMLNGSPDSGFEESRQSLILRCFAEFRPFEIDFGKEPLPKRKCTTPVTLPKSHTSRGGVKQESACNHPFHPTLVALKAEFLALFEDYKKLLEPVQAPARLIVEAGRLLKEEDDPEVIAMLKHEILAAGQLMNSEEYVAQRNRLNAMKCEMASAKMILEARKCACQKKD